MKRNQLFHKQKFLFSEKIIIVITFIFVIFFSVPSGHAESGKRSSDTAVVLAVEFNSHAACAHVARHKGLFEAEGVQIEAFDNYVTGAALAAALARGDIDAAYVCLIPAINVIVNGAVPLKVVAGTHKYGYALVVDPAKIRRPEDLGAHGVRIGCTQPGTPSDILLHKVIDTWKLSQKKILANIRRMNPSKQLLALKKGRIDAAFVPEQYPRMAEQLGFMVLLTARDVWPDMQGSVLVATDQLIQAHPDIVEKLVRVTENATCWIDNNLSEASVIVSEKLNWSGAQIFSENALNLNSGFTITPEVVKASLSKGLVCSTDINVSEIEKTIIYMGKLGYLRREITPEEVVDLTWLGK